jgi:pimeloyl-ACP methyl ester carboxylesterase
MTSHSESQLLTLSDGRTLAYANYGASASSHLPIFYHHGCPTSGVECALWHEAALSLDIRLIAVDRPGIGISTFQSSRTILDWPNDLLALADHLEIQQFNVLGFSGGAPYALSCAKMIPETRMKRVVVMAGLYPLDLGMEGMIPKNQRMFWWAASWWLSPLLAPVLEFRLRRRAWNNPQVFDEAFMSDLPSLPEVDRRCFDDNAIRTLAVTSMREAFRTSSKGVACDLRLLSLPWGFELTDIERKDLTLWHGVLDLNVPITMARKAVKKLKGAKLKEIEAKGHYSLAVSHIDEILRTFVQDTTGVSSAE